MRNSKTYKISAFLLFAVLIAAFTYLYLAAPVGTGYASKYVCSAVFTSGQDPQEAMDLFVKPVHPLFEVVSCEVDYGKKEVTARMFGFLRPMTSLYRDGCGCTLMVDTDRQTLLNQSAEVELDRPVLPDTVWPAGNRVNLDSVPSNIDLSALNKVIRAQFGESSDDPAEMTNTLAIVVAYQDRIIAGQYREGVTENTPLLSWSASKSVTSALFGTLVKNKGLDIYAPAPVAAWQHDDRKNITIDHLLRMESGLAFEEVYAPMTDAVEMLYESPSMGDYAASMPLEAPPGEKWAYSSGTTNILAGILLDLTGGDLASLDRYAHENLFDKIGMQTAVFEHDASGAFVGSSYFYASAKDWLRFCLLYKNDGVWNGERILPEGWVEYSTTPTPHAPQGKYGAQIWLNAGEKGNPENRMFPKLPTDTYMFEGYQGQWFMVIPSKDLMIARFGVTNHENWSMEELVVGVLGAIE